MFLLTTKNAFVPVKHVYSVNTYSRISTVPREGVGEVSELAQERSERSEASVAKRSGVSGASERT